MKRFSVRETALLMAPVLVMGALGWWMSKRPLAPTATRATAPVRFKFVGIETPSMIERFQGISAVFRVKVENDDEKNLFLATYQPHLEWRTPESEISQDYSFALSYATALHMPVKNENDVRILVRMKNVPAESLFFSMNGIVRPSSSSKTAMPIPPKTFRVNGRWKVESARIKAINLAALPRQPLVSLREVVITQKVTGDARSGTMDRVTGEAVFDLHGAKVDKKTAFDLFYNEITRSTRGAIFGVGGSSGSEKDTLRRRVPQWNFSPATPAKRTTKARISGRVSADSRWPLGFEIEPFNFNTAKVGQKLKFKQFPVPLPKG